MLSDMGAVQSKVVPEASGKSKAAGQAELQMYPNNDFYATQAMHAHGDSHV